MKPLNYKMTFARIFLGMFVALLLFESPILWLSGITLSSRTTLDFILLGVLLLILFGLPLFLGFRDSDDFQAHELKFLFKNPKDFIQFAQVFLGESGWELKSRSEFFLVFQKSQLIPVLSISINDGMGKVFGAKLYVERFARKAREKGDFKEVQS